RIFVSPRCAAATRVNSFNEIELGKILTAEALLENRSQFSVAFREKREVAFGAANVAGQNHGFPLRELNRFKACRTNQGVYHLRPSRSSKASDSRGPQLPDAYRGTEAVLAALQTSKMGSTSCQAASTLSPRSKSVTSPRTQSLTKVA